LEVSKPYFGTFDTCGFMNPERVTSFLNWIVAKQLENSEILAQNLFTNEFLVRKSRK
jgi:hypothetical protein